MKNKKVVLIAVVVLLLLFAAGCDSRKTEPVQPPQEQPPVSTLKTEEKQPEKIEYGEITDPAVLEKLWQEYLYDSIATVGNTREFNSAAEIDPTYIAMFSWFKYISEHGEGSLPLVSKDSTLRLFPLEVVLKYANRYFNLISLDVSKVEKHYYDPGKRAFLFSMGMEGKRPSYTENNPWGFQLDKVTRNTDGTVTAVMVQYHPYQTRRIELIRTLTLKEREDGSLYFVKGKWEYANNKLVALTGDYQRFEKISGFDGDMQELSMVGEVDGRMILAYTPYVKEKNTVLMIVTPNTMKVEKKLDLGTNCEYSDIKLAGDALMVRLKDKVITLTKDLTSASDIPLPQVIADKIAREPKYDEDGNPIIFFGGYDLSQDRTKFIYADEAGLKLWNIADNSKKLLAKTVDIKGSQLINHSYHMSPRFVAGDKKVMTTMSGYEGNLGYTLYDLDNGEAKRFYMDPHGSSATIRYDTGFLGVNTYNRHKETSEYKSVYLDFATGNVHEIKLANPGETGDIRFPDMCYVGKNHAAFITYTRDGNDNANHMSYINRLNLKTLKVEPEVVSVKAAGTHILGVLADGRIVFWYELNPSEKGLCITK